MMNWFDEFVKTKDEKLGRFTGSQYICHTKPMTTQLSTEPGVGIRLLLVVCPDLSVCIMIKIEKFSLSNMLRS